MSDRATDVRLAVQSRLCSALAEMASAGHAGGVGITKLHTNLTGWPLVRIEPKGTEQPPPETARRELQELIEELRTRRGRFALIADPSEAPVPSAAVRREAGLFVAELFRMKEPECVGIAMVASSTVLRGALRAVLWFVDPDKPCTVCGSRVEAERWAQRALGGGLDAMAP